MAKAFKARRVRLRKGHWRVSHEDVAWYVDLRSDGPRPDAALTFEVGAWVPALGLTAEPEGGAVDCPLLYDLPLDTQGDLAAQVDMLVDLLERLEDVPMLAKAWRSGELSGALVDRDLQELLRD